MLCIIAGIILVPFAWVCVGPFMGIIIMMFMAVGAAVEIMVDGYLYKDTNITNVIEGEGYYYYDSEVGAIRYIVND